MKKMVIKHFGETCTIKFNDSPKVMKKVFDALIHSFYIKHMSFSGESIMQRDNPQIEAPVILAEIADDIIKFDIEWEPINESK